MSRKGNSPVTPREAALPGHPLLLRSCERDLLYSYDPPRFLGICSWYVVYGNCNVGSHCPISTFNRALSGLANWSLAPGCKPALSICVLCDSPLLGPTASGWVQLVSRLSSLGLWRGGWGRDELRTTLAPDTKGSRRMWMIPAFSCALTCP
jgi:hypothetical protein